jgi:hypothetical protein
MIGPNPSKILMFLFLIFNDKEKLKSKVKNKKKKLVKKLIIKLLL